MPDICDQGERVINGILVFFFSFLFTKKKSIFPLGFSFCLVWIGFFVLFFGCCLFFCHPFPTEDLKQTKPPNCHLDKSKQLLNIKIMKLIPKGDNF